MQFRQKQLRLVGIISVAACLAASTAFGASKEQAKEEPPEAVIKRLYPKLPASGVKKTEIEDFYEVVADGNVLYINVKTGHVFVGDIFTREGKNLTAEARSRLTAERFKLITDADKAKAVKVGNGKHVVIEITDPDCPFCRKMHEYWGNRPDVTRYVFFLPLAMHKDAEKKARYILSAENKELALWEVYSGELDNNRDRLDKPYDDKGLLNFHKSVAAKLGIQSTPAFWVDGTFVNGANISLIEKVIGKCNVKPGTAAGEPKVCEEDEPSK